METKNKEQYETEPEEKGIGEAAQEAREILGLKPESTLRDIKRVYRALALEYHPDKNPGDEIKAAEIFNRLQELYEILCDEIEFRQNETEDEFKDEQENLDLVELGDVFLPTLEVDVDPIIWKMIKAYQSECMKQNEDKGNEVDIQAKGSAKDDDDDGKGANIDIKV